MMPPAPRSLNAGGDFPLAQESENAVGRAHEDVFEKRIRNLNGTFVGGFVLRIERHRRERGAAESAGIGGLADQHDVPAVGTGRNLE